MTNKAQRLGKREERGTPDPRAIKVAAMVAEQVEPELTILFGSRARGDYQEDRSDIDIMLVTQTEPGESEQRQARDRAARMAGAVYSQEVTVQLVWVTESEFRQNLEYRTRVEAKAVRDGVIMPRNPDDYSWTELIEDKTGHKTDWADYERNLDTAGAHRNAFQVMAEQGVADESVGLIGQKALEHGMKSLITALGGEYPETHDIGQLIGTIRRLGAELHPEFRQFGTSIPPDVYTAYEGSGRYTARARPRLNTYDNWAERTLADVDATLEIARVTGAIRQESESREE